MEEMKIIQGLRFFENKLYDSNFSDRAFKCFEAAACGLEMLQKYRELGTVEELREAVGKQTPKTPDYEGDGYSGGELVYDTWICPCCRKDYEVDYDNYDYCPNCGQHIERR